MKFLCFALLLAAADHAWAGDEWEIDWYTIDGGGEVLTAGGEWALSGTIGQWDASETHQLTGGPWQLTGGFWGLTLEQLADVLFRDRFEVEE